MYDFQYLASGLKNFLEKYVLALDLVDMDTDLVRPALNADTDPDPAK